MKNLREEGTFELITGPMFSGKTTALVKRLDDLKDQGYQISCFKPAIDNRYNQNHIVSHAGLKTKARAVNSASEILKHLEGQDLIIIDEIQFFSITIKIFRFC